MSENINSKKIGQLVTTAQELMMRHGIHRVTVEEICSDANISKMTFYKYFKNKIELTKSIKIAAIYLILAGCAGILLPLIGIGPNHPEFQAKSFAFKAGSYARENLINILFLLQKNPIHHLSNYPYNL